MVTNELQMVEFAYSIIGVHVPYRYTTYTAVNYILHITCTCVHGGMCVVPVPGTVGTSYIINGEELAIKAI